MNIIAWSEHAPWAELRQVEQDLIISRAIVAIFSDPVLRQQLRFRGGTALNKLHFQTPLRYSEDIDLVRTEAGPLGPLLDRVRATLEPWLGRANFEQSPVAPKLRFRVDAEDGPPPIRLKVEINTREIEAYDPPVAIPFAVMNPWFAGNTEIATFSDEEMLATKLRALLQRNKGRDLFDLDHALRTLPRLRPQRIVELFCRYLEATDLPISRAQAEQRMFAKLANRSVLLDMRPLLPPAQAMALSEETTVAAFERVFGQLIERVPGERWARTEEFQQQFRVRPMSVRPENTEL